MLRKIAIGAAAVCAVLTVASVPVQAQSAPAKWGLSGIEYYSSNVGCLKIISYSWHMPGYAKDTFQIVSSTGYTVGQAAELLSASYSNGILTLVLRGTWNGSPVTYTIDVRNDGTYQEPLSMSVSNGTAINPGLAKPQSGWLHVYYL